MRNSNASERTHLLNFDALELIDRLLAQLKNHMIPINFHLDLAKAFDSLNHNILLDKLSYYGVNGTAKTLLKSYLSDRKQYVKIDEVKSSHTDN